MLAQSLADSVVPLNLCDKMPRHLATATILVLEKAPDVLELLVADAFPPGAPGLKREGATASCKGKVQHRTKDAINAHLLTQYCFPASEEGRKPYKQIWEDLEQALDMHDLCTRGMNSLSKMAMTRAQIKNLF